MTIGAPETLVLNMPKLVWSVLTTVKERDPLSSEVICFSIGLPQIFLLGLQILTILDIIYKYVIVCVGT